MRVIELNGKFLGEVIPVGIAAAEPAHRIGEGAGNEKVLLYEPQTLSDAGGVIGVQHPGDGFRGKGLGQRAYEVAAAEFPEVEIVGCRGGPQPKCVDCRTPVAYDRTIVWEADETA